MYKFLVVFFCFFSLSSETIAQEIKNDSILKVVTVTGFSKGEKINKQSAPIAYLSPEELNSFSPNDPVMAWNTLPGVNLEQRAVASYRVSIRGSSIRSPFGVRDVKVYWNGLPFTEANGSTALNLLSNSQMQELEVVKGPAGSLYGAGLGGVMQINNFPSQKESPVQVHLSGGSFNQFNLGVKGQVEHDKWNTFYAIDHQQNDGYRDHNSLNRQNYQLSSRYQVNENHQLDFHVLYNDLFYEIPGGLTAEQFAADPTQARSGSAPQNSSIDQKTVFYGLGYTSFFGENLSQSTHIAGTYTQFENPFILDYKEDQNREVALRHQWTYDMGLESIDWQWDAGLEWQYANNAANNYGNVNGKKDSIRFADELNIDRKLFFLQTQIGLENWQLTLGLSSNLLNYTVNRKVNAFAEPFEFNRNFDNEVIPRVAVKYQWTSQNMTFASLSEGFSSPTLDEIRTNEGSINRNLQAEKGRTYELGHKYYGSRIQLDATFFYSSLRETITTYTNPDGVVLFQNAGATNQLGTEWGLNVNWYENEKGILNNINSRTSYNFYEFTFNDYQKEEEDFSGNLLTGVPQHTFNHVLNLSIANKVSLNLHYRYVSETPLTDDNVIVADPYHLLNANIDFKVPGSLKLNLFGGIENIFNTTYSLGNDLNAFGGRFFQPAPGRNFHLGAKWSL
ncbi:iron complex outermembrane recepter protein [Marivirga sericea]|uniref:Iron complex outermembrane recepter protein n=1 Tax=Marivirga sericea TaxID=1028 RepID=A0A1X7LH87_9BACT|nr:TonB-dependent receptor [Marivirga sericea]SMG52549.1 iron complex outermembrane recepter protein [Marivirga sericea]